MKLGGGHSQPRAVADSSSDRGCEFGRAQLVNQLVNVKPTPTIRLGYNFRVLIPPHRTKQCIHVHPHSRMIRHTKTLGHWTADGQCALRLHCGKMAAYVCSPPRVDMPTRIQVFITTVLHLCLLVPHCVYTHRCEHVYIVTHLRVPTLRRVTRIQ
jgi:hypothetical protein